jgi:hypothetical protein
VSSDLLKRHTSGHKDEPSSKRQDTSQKSANSRVSKACIPCAEAKLRCEGSNPCIRCLNRGILCEYAQPRSRKSTHFSQHSNGGVENSQSVPQAGSLEQQNGSMSFGQNNNSVLAHVTQSPGLVINNDQYSQEQGDVTMNSGDQAVLDTQLPRPIPYDQGMQHAHLFRLY